MLTATDFGDGMTEKYNGNGNGVIEERIRDSSKYHLADALDFYVLLVGESQELDEPRMEEFKDYLIAPSVSIMSRVFEGSNMSRGRNSKIIGIVYDGLIEEIKNLYAFREEAEKILESREKESNSVSI